MQLGLLAVSVVLGGTMQPKLPDPHVSVSSGTSVSIKRMYQWILVPGGGTGAIPTPFMVLVPMSKNDLSKVVKSGKLRQELHIIIETDSIQKTKDLTTALIEGVRQIMEDNADLMIPEAPVFSTLPCKPTKSDPKQVIDPVVSGF